jgi:mannitol-1-phosphate 5-dehydrogenase
MVYKLKTQEKSVGNGDGMKLIQFGAGNIGRSFIGQVFSRAGWEVVFVDVDPKLTGLLNERGTYTVAIKREGQADEFRSIGPVRAVDGRDAAAVAAELADADMASTSVGKNALPKVLPVIARGLAERRRLHGDLPLDIIIAENDREAPELFRRVLSAELGPSYPLEKLAGIVETSIGKMVPIMKAADLAGDPLLLFAEEYENLIVDAKGFRASLPNIPALHPVNPIAAYVDRKLFVHNLGHAAAAYFGWIAAAAAGGAKPGLSLSEVLLLPGVEAAARKAMNQAADALVKEYPASYSREDLNLHIEDLIFRFKNKALGDTVHRVGRDLRRKLSREDRITGAMLLCAKHSLPFDAIAAVYRAALEFAAPGENGELFPADAEFRAGYADAGRNPAVFRTLLREVSGLSAGEISRFGTEPLGTSGFASGTELTSE